MEPRLASNLGYLYGSASYMPSLGLIPSIHLEANSPRGPNASLTSMGTGYAHSTQTYVQVKHSYTLNK